MDWPFTAILLPAWAAALLAFAPAVLRWHVDRALRREADDSTLPERLFALQARIAAVTAGTIALLVTAGGRHLLWALPLSWLASQVMAHRTRRWLFGDTWSLGAQLAWNVRLLVAFAGFWWTAALLPAAVIGLGLPPWAGLPAGAALLAWNHWHAAIFLRVLGARGLARPDLDAVFEPVLERARTRRPEIHVAGPQDAVVANAFALPAPGRNHVLFFRGLLDRLEPHECAAILAHELAHLETFDAGLRVRWYAAGAALAIGASLVPALAVATGHGGLIAAAWVVMALLLLVVRAVRWQRHELASDRRGVELCGDAEHLVSALCRLHALARIPRRWNAQHDRQATHPSLARRIQSIRASAGAAPPQQTPIVTRAFTSPETGRAVIFEPERLLFLWTGRTLTQPDVDALVQHAERIEPVRYANLVELRVTRPSAHQAMLIAADRQGRAWKLRLDPQDAPAVQEMLDLADQQLAPASADPRRLHSGSRLAGACLVLVSMLGGMWALVVPALLTIWRPVAGLPAALIVGALAYAGLGLRPSAPRYQWALALVAALSGLLLAIVQQRVRREHSLPAPPPVRIATAILLASAGIAIAVLAPFAAHGYEDLHYVARATPGAAAMQAALAAYLFGSPGRRRRIASLLPCAAALAIVAVGSTAFRDRFSPDPLRFRSAPVRPDTTSLERASTLRVEGRYVRLTLSPDGEYVALTGMPGSGTDPVRHVIASFDGWQRVTEADEVIFSAPGQVLLVRRRVDMALSAEPLREGGASWSARIERTYDGRVELDPATGRWRVHTALDSEEIEGGTTWHVVEGRVGTAAVNRHEWPVRGTPGTYVAATAMGPSDTAVALAYRWEPPPFPLPLMGFLPAAPITTLLLHTTPHSTRLLAATRLDVTCSAPASYSRSVTCLGSGDGETRLWTVDVETGSLTPPTSMPGRVSPLHVGDAGIVGGHEDGLLLIRPDLAHATWLDLEEEGGAVLGAAAAGGWLVTFDADGPDTLVRRYRLPPPPAPAGTRSARR